MLNLLRGDLPRLGRCTGIRTGDEGSPLPRVKPFKYTYEKEIVMYAYFKKLDYFSTECIYAPYAARGFAREFVKDLEVGSSLAELPCISTLHCPFMKDLDFGIVAGCETTCNCGSHPCRRHHAHSTF